MFHNARLEFQRKKILRKAPEGALRDYASVPLPDLSTPMGETEFLVLDFETTGLDSAVGRILSAGYTINRGTRVLMSQSRHHLVRHKKDIPGESVAVHFITEEAARGGEPLLDVMDTLLEKLQGRVLVAHYAPIEVGYINKACKVLYGFTPPMRVIDTLALEHRWRQRYQAVVRSNSLRLFNLRNDYALPRYKAHNALTDAIATAELLLAQVSSQPSGSRLPLKQFLTN